MILKSIVLSVTNDTWESKDYNYMGQITVNNNSLIDSPFPYSFKHHIIKE